jgi:hypothetical protein
MEQKKQENIEETLFELDRISGQIRITAQETLSTDSYRDLTVESPSQKPDGKTKKAPLPNTWRVSVDASVHLAARQICQACHADTSHYLTLAASFVLRDIDELVFAQINDGLFPKPVNNKALNRIPVARQLLVHAIDRARATPEGQSPSIYILERIANRIAEQRLSQHLVYEVKKLIVEDRARQCPI